MNKSTLTIFIIVLVLGFLYYAFFVRDQSGTAHDTVVVSSDDRVDIENSGEFKEINETNAVTRTSSREILLSESITLPVGGSAPISNVKHSVPIEEIRRGCFRQDCIPSVNNPVFVSVNEAQDILPEDTIGIGLDYKGVKRFYPFNMLVTREVVNDIAAGDPILVTYCPLCGTGIVFNRSINGIVYEFGVSGMLWQSNLLMYNRAENIEDRNLWSQVLGEAVVGNSTGVKLQIISSDIVRFTDWSKNNTEGEVLNTGRIGDPYNGDYYGVARNFAPNFDEENSLLDPSAYVFGIEINSKFKAYPRDSLPVGDIIDEVNGTKITVRLSDDNTVVITNEENERVPVVSGFWFSWVAAHPDTELWSN